MEETQFYLNVLKGNECQCGNGKDVRRAICYSCYRQLPNFMQKALYKPIRRGFEQAYDDAVEYLNS